MLWLQIKYINLISNSLRNFKRTANNTFVCSCPICGDSKSNKFKKRFYFYTKNTDYYICHCHNCGYSKNFERFLETFNNLLYHEYKLEKLKETNIEHFINKPEKKKFDSQQQFRSLQKISKLNKNHPAQIFLDQRKIPKEKYDELYYTAAFKQWINTIIPYKFNNTDNDSGRIIIPFKNNNKITGIQGRAIDKKEKLRYITIVFDENYPTIYNLDSIDFSQTNYCFEGPFDSMFINNSFSSAGGELSCRLTNLDYRKTIIVYDNEPRSKETKTKMINAIKQGFSVCVWPENLLQKDVNQMIIDGIDKEYVKNIIDKCTVKGLSGEFLIRQWSKV